MRVHNASDPVPEKRGRNQIPQQGVRSRGMGNESSQRGDRNQSTKGKGSNKGTGKDRRGRSNASPRACTAPTACESMKGGKPSHGADGTGPHCATSGKGGSFFRLCRIHRCGAGNGIFWAAREADAGGTDRKVLPACYHPLSSTKSQPPVIGAASTLPTPRLSPTPSSRAAEVRPTDAKHPYLPGAVQAFSPTAPKDSTTPVGKEGVAPMQVPGRPVRGKWRRLLTHRERRSIRRLSKM